MMSNTTDLGYLTVEEILQRRSITLIGKPNARLQEQKEIESYLSKFSTQYLSEVKTLSLVDSFPLPKTVRIIITIIAYGEGAKMKKTLNNYVKQDIDPKSFEIIILDNHPQSVDRDNTITEVQNFKYTHPAISVVYAYKVWKDGEYATIGNARKYVFDIALARIHNRGNSEKDTILVSNDADTIDLDTNYLSTILSEFDTNSTTDALVTLSVVPFSSIVKPNIYAALSLWDALDEAVARGEPYNLIGRSSAYRSSIYAAVGGYNPKGKMAGDLETGTIISDAREWNPASVIQLKKTKHVQDPRRILEAVASRVPVNEMYYKFVSNPEIRQADNKKLFSLIPDELDWELFEEDADSFWQGRSTGMYKWRGNRFADDFHCAMDKIGGKFEIINDRVKLINLDKLVSQYKKVLGENIHIIHSKPRTWDPKRQAEMKRFFLSISDSIIALRTRQAEKIEAKIKTLNNKNKINEISKLREEFKRFAGYEYVDN